MCVCICMYIYIYILSKVFCVFVYLLAQHPPKKVPILLATWSLLACVSDGHCIEARRRSLTCRCTLKQMIVLLCSASLWWNTCFFFNVFFMICSNDFVIFCCTRKEMIVCVHHVWLDLLWFVSPSRGPLVIVKLAQPVFHDCSNVGKTAINHLFADGLYRLFMVILGMVCYCFAQINWFASDSDMIKNHT